ncbi:amidohydrolase family protein [Lysobacter arenosi]|jgi:imidazolonepropionase-like amidohydrolase|uniref:Amidohydrolase family protein n=1 Tax=Lysobacter arenosi TaxID=2795387 RepID=A0ABX7R8Y1_9GAMM|nr:amidohydrolase family protein [Lysobacter arenosi]QSX74572.1 amidohydrolase family protein [Lysobacter arenosi]
MHGFRRGWWLALLLLTGAADAAERIALVGGTLVDGTLREPIQDSVVLIDGERITAVGSVGTLPVPAGTRVISTEGMTVLPGLWDMHVHLMINGHADYEHWDKTYPDRFRDVIMPASAKQLLLAGVTGARDLGGPLEDSIAVRDAINSGKIPGPTLFVSGPFIQKKPYPGTEQFRWGVDSPSDARRKVRRLAEAGVDVVKLIDQDQMSEAEVQAIVDEAHKHKLPVVAHAHRPEEIRRGLKAGVDCFEHTGLGASPEYPEDVMAALRERTGNMAAGPIFWTPTIEGLFNFPYTVRNHEFIDGDAWHEGLPPDIVADIRHSLEHPERIAYFQQTPQRWPTLKRKFQQLRESGVVMLVGTDSGIPMKFHSGSTWNELDVWVNQLGVPAVDAIRAATYWPAVAMKADKDYGSVVEGKYADIIAVKGDVLKQVALLQRVDVVIKHGKQVK